MSRRPHSPLYTSPKKISGYWTINLITSGLLQFRSLSRKLAEEWRNTNEPIPAPCQLNASVGVAVWRCRD